MVRYSCPTTHPTVDGRLSRYRTYQGFKVFWYRPRTVRRTSSILREVEVEVVIIYKHINYRLFVKSYQYRQMSTMKSFCQTSNKVLTKQFSILNFTIIQKKDHSIWNLNVQFTNFVRHTTSSKFYLRNWSRRLNRPRTLIRMSK